jgi:probable addiction module antidote protein
MRPTPPRRPDAPFPPDELVPIARELDALLARGDDAEVLDALRDLARRTGGVGRIAETAGLNRTFLYRMLSPAGNPEMRTVAAVLRALGLRLGIQPLVRQARPPRALRPRARRGAGRG